MVVLLQLLPTKQQRTAVAGQRHQCAEACRSELLKFRSHAFSGQVGSRSIKEAAQSPYCEREPGWKVSIASRRLTWPAALLVRSDAGEHARRWLGLVP
jgi:hypothetical protein